jgi:hypothetical protein
MERAPDRDDDDVETIASDDPSDDTSGGPLSSGAGEGSGQDAPGAPDVDVPGGAADGGDATGDAAGGG